MPDQMQPLRDEISSRGWAACGVCFEFHSPEELTNGVCCACQEFQDEPEPELDCQLDGEGERSHP